MHPSDLAAFTPETREAARAAFGLGPELRLLSDWHAFTFAGVRQGLPCILRVTPASHQSAAAIEAELEWQHFVIEHGRISAPRALPSIRGSLTETLAAPPTSFTAVLFEKLSGRPIGTGDWTPVLFKEWGRLVGALHALSLDYAPKSPRSPWSASDFLNLAYIPDSETDAKRGAAEVVAEVGRLEPKRGIYGMIHGDVYQDNLFIGRAGLQLFDFDLCELGYYASDIAVSLYAALWRHDDAATADAFARRFLEAFLTGYTGQFALPREELRRLPLFLRLREVLIYIVAWKKWPLSEMSPKARRLLDERGGRIGRREPVVDLSWI